ncbi:hypothetical protein [Piscinibacter sp. HJYY11]|uniref:hypothetical protein n=1 Tax=Piscinibacter sp. HJYY11 TaxID=2801333 RepID=UPI00191CF23A|nr:hypothetical protein [Piscinibacter sp. HJYY11]MBL0727902.1 hypothetical protein [Piscinibacter sp. HJYY11]
MHAPPPFQITARHFGMWRWACAGLVSISGLVLAGWALSAGQLHPAWLALSLLLWAVASISLLLQAWRLEPVSLRWDGQLWHVGPEATAGQEPQAGGMSVTVDLGSWVLLRFVRQDSRRGLWLPLQRSGHELSWHGLRATVYCARPVSLPTAAPF